MSANYKTAVFIDGPNLHTTAKNLNLKIDYKRLHAYLHEEYEILRIFYYTAMLESREDDGFQTLRPLVDWLAYNGFSVRTKVAKEYVDAQGRQKIKGNMDIDITLDVLKIAQTVSTIILFTGDGDFRPLVESVQFTGVHVNVHSSIVTKPSMISDDLRRQADSFVDINDIADRITKL